MINKFMSKKNFLLVVSVFIFTLVLSIAVQSLMAAWSEPSDTPPNGNLDAPINTGNQTQTKSGVFKAAGGLVIPVINEGGTTPNEEGSIWLQK